MLFKIIMYPRYPKLACPNHLQRQLIILFILIIVAIPSMLIAEASKPQTPTAQSQRSTPVGFQQQSNNANTTSGTDPPSYIAIGRKISKILNDFFDVSVDC